MICYGVSKFKAASTKLHVYTLKRKIFELGKFFQFAVPTVVLFE